MKKLLTLILIFAVITSSFGQSKRSRGSGSGDAVAAAVGITAGIAAAAYYEHQMREMVEQSAMEWVLSNREIANGDFIEVKLIEWEVKAITDISTTSNLLFKYKRNDEPYEVILFILSSGWWNENGIEYTKVKPITIDIELWTDILATFMDVASVDTVLNVYNNDSLVLKYDKKISRRRGDGSYYTETIKVNYPTDFKSLEKIKGRSLRFVDSEDYEVEVELIKIKGDEHIIGILENDKLLLDYNEKRINLYNKSTQDLIKFNINTVNEIHRLLLREPFLLDAL